MGVRGTVFCCMDSRRIICEMVVWRIWEGLLCILLEFND